MAIKMERVARISINNGHSVRAVASLSDAEKVLVLETIATQVDIAHPARVRACGHDTVDAYLEAFCRQWEETHCDIYTVG